MSLHCEIIDDLTMICFCHFDCNFCIYNPLSFIGHKLANHMCFVQFLQIAIELPIYPADNA